ncbi:MAG: terminase [Anaerolineae bacterium]|nr:terminase [Anaerolineae bacterium]
MSGASDQQADTLLCEDMATFYADPLGFVMYAYPWDTDAAIQMVELVDPWRSRYQCRFGPDAWACKFLDELGSQVNTRGFDGRSAVEPIRESTASGHGIGKSTITAWIIDWIMSTRPFAKGVVTANTSSQLETKTWAELAKWTKKSVTGHWFDVATGKGSMKMVHKGYPEAWRCDAQTCREENSEAFAGLHAANSTPFYIFDEASAVPDKIWEVAEGGLTDGEPMFFAFGNPTRNTGMFSRTFGALRHRWNTRQIDSRDVAITNKTQIAEWEHDYGDDSDFFRVRVKGQFPRSSSTQFIPTDIVSQARERDPFILPSDPLVIGVDVARFGDDESVICFRRGRDARSIPVQRFRQIDTMELAARVAQAIEQHSPDAVFVDQTGVGGGVVDRLRQLGHGRVVEGIDFSARSIDPKYANQRAYMWGMLRDWLQEGAAIMNSNQLESDLIGPEYSFTPKNQILLERKEDMKRRGLASPDEGDALALTFARPIGPRKHSSDPLQSQKQQVYDPFRKLNQRANR